MNATSMVDAVGVVGGRRGGRCGREKVFDASNSVLALRGERR